MPFGASRLILMLVGATFLSTCLHPTVEVYEAAVTGTVSDSAGKPIAGARVLRMDTWGPRTEVVQFASTDTSGMFRLAQMERIRWWHPPIEYAMGWVHCSAAIQVRATGFKPYASKHGDRSLTRHADESIGCNDARFFKPVVLVREGSAR